VYMGAEDVERQALNVFRMRLLGARVIPVEAGSRTLKDAINEALRDWVTNVRTTYYLLGSALGPHPYPMMVRDFHAVIGRETRRQARTTLGRLPDVLVACVGGGSNAIGLFHPFIGDRRVRIIGVEPGGEGIATGRHGASMTAGTVGVLHGCMSYLLQDDDGQIATAHSISAGLDYPAGSRRPSTSFARVASAPWWPTSPPAIPRSRRRSGSCWRRRRAALTSSSSACPSRTPSPTARSSSARRCAPASGGRPWRGCSRR